MDDADKARRQKAIDNQLMDAKEKRVIETSVKGKGTETLPTTQSAGKTQKDHWLSTKPCSHCNIDFRDFNQRSTACQMCRNAMAKNKLPERLHRLKFDKDGNLSNHPINAKKE